MLSHQLPVAALVGRYPANKLMGRETIPGQQAFSPPTMRLEEIIRC
jgi:hypothetical protein